MPKSQHQNLKTPLNQTARPFNKQRLAHLSLADQITFEKFGQGPVVKPQYQCIHHAFEQQAILRPQAIAAQHLDQTISYSQLNNQANRLAILLQQKGVKRGDNVALFIHRSIPMLVGMLACIKVGASYVPQHVTVAPKIQLAHVLKTISAKVVLTLSNLKHLVPVPKQCHCICIDRFMQSAARQPNIDNTRLLSQHRISTDDVCFILFTSGTTGKPNGVKVTHRNLCNILLTAPGNLSVLPGMKVAQILSIAFDMAAWEIFVCLSHGGTLLIRGDEIQQTAEQANVIIATPSILNTIDQKKCTQVETVAVAGEPCPKPLADAWSMQCNFYNSCGPTETTIINTAQHYQSAKQPLSIGKPTPNNTVYILDERMQACAIGEVGEMWAGGDCVTAGYLDNTELNQQRYSPDPFLNNGESMFRTRDLGRWMNNGELEHLGRTDDQVKIRGFRVELDTVSVALEATTGCRKAVTLKLDDRHLVAFISPFKADIELAKKVVTAQLPYYCVPKKIISLDKFPITSRGKIDKRALLSLALRHIELDQQPQEMHEC